MRIKIKKAKWRASYRWAAMGALVAYSATGNKNFSLLRARDLPTPPRQTRGSQPSLRFDIPAGSLDAVLEAFQKITGLSVAIEKEGLGTIASPGVSGVYTTDQALLRLLAGTGLDYRFASAGSVSVDVKTFATSMDVTANIETLAASSPKYAGPLRDTPQSVTEVPQQLMQEQGSTTLRDALRNVAGISLAAGEGGAQGDNLTIRGFTARNDLFIDGMRDFGSYYRDPFNTEAVEVLQGPSSVTFGRGSTGGVVNQTAKAPGLMPSISGDVDFGTDLTRRGTLDLNVPLSLLRQGAAFRLNLMGDENNVSGRDVAESRRFGVAPSLALGLGTRTRLTLSYFHQTADDTPDYGIPWLFNGPAPVDRRNYYGFRDGNYLRTHDDIGTAKVEHEFNSRFTLRDQVRYASYARGALITEARLAGTVTPSTPLDAITVNRGQIGVDSEETYLAEQMDLTARFQTGFARHNLVTGIEAGRETSDPTRPTWTNVPATSLLAPNPADPFSGSSTITSKVNTSAASAAAYVLDTIGFGSHWDLTGGIRWDRFDADYKQLVAPVAAFSRVDQMPTWRAALVYKPVAIGSIYAAAGTSFNPSAESLSLSAGNANLPPEKSRTYETGTKWDVLNKRLSLRAAVFRTEKINARETDPTNSLSVVLAGNQRVDGAQFEVHGRLTSRWEIQSSFAYLDGKVVSSRFYPAAIGAQLANVPRNTLNFWTNYRWRAGWETGFGGNYVSSRTASSTVPFDPVSGLVKEVPGYWVFNAMAKHRLTEHIDLQVNVNNLANRYYYDQIHPAHIVPGAGRSALIGLKFKF